jgi:hypothetical protein
LRVILPWANAFADGEPKAAGLADDSDETWIQEEVDQSASNPSDIPWHVIKRTLTETQQQHVFLVCVYQSFISLPRTNI